jgi:shikimate dehydrogenase
VSIAVVVTRPALWLIGHGIAASPSPAMQNAALRACGLDWEYAIRDVSPDALGDVLAEMREGSLVRGANVTMPHKRAVADACDELAGDAAIAGAVNTVTVAEGRLVGDNTDARGLESALRADGLWPSAGASVVVLGAGGAAAAALLAFSRAEPWRMHVAARRPDIARQVAPQFDAAALAFEPAAVAQALRGAPHGVLVNATPAGLDALPVDVGALPASCAVVDLRYRPRPVDLVAAARARGLPACDGLGMLLHQGMLSFARWTGLEPPWAAAQAALDAAAAGS